MNTDERNEQIHYLLALVDESERNYALIKQNLLDIGICAAAPIEALLRRCHKQTLRRQRLEELLVRLRWERDKTKFYDLFERFSLNRQPQMLYVIMEWIMGVLASSQKINIALQKLDQWVGEARQRIWQALTHRHTRMGGPNAYVREATAILMSLQQLLFGEKHFCILPAGTIEQTNKKQRSDLFSLERLLVKQNAPYSTFVLFGLVILRALKLDHLCVLHMNHTPYAYTKVYKLGFVQKENEQHVDFCAAIDQNGKTQILTRKHLSRTQVIPVDDHTFLCRYFSSLQSKSEGEKRYVYKQIHTLFSRNQANV